MPLARAPWRYGYSPVKIETWDEFPVEELSLYLQDRLKAAAKDLAWSLPRMLAETISRRSSVKGFQDLGMEPTYESIAAINRAGVVIDCTPSGVGTQSKPEDYDKYVAIGESDRMTLKFRKPGADP